MGVVLGRDTIPPTIYSISVFGSSRTIDNSKARRQSQDIKGKDWFDQSMIMFHACRQLLRYCEPSSRNRLESTDHGEDVNDPI